jgi:hypothetical protein
MSTTLAAKMARLSWPGRRYRCWSSRVNHRLPIAAAGAAMAAHVRKMAEDPLIRDLKLELGDSPSHIISVLGIVGDLELDLGCRVQQQ